MMAEKVDMVLHPFLVMIIELHICVNWWVLGWSFRVFLASLDFGTLFSGKYPANESFGLRRHDVGVYPVTAGEHTDCGVIDTSVGLMPFHVLVPILDGSDTENDEER